MTMNWHNYFFNIAYQVASKSKDQSTNFGAVIVDDDNNIVSTGYNSFPRGINDDLDERQERPDKYLFMEHAERNAIYAAARKGVATKDCFIYIQTMPCADCARAIVQSGIVKLYLHSEWLEQAPEEFKDWGSSQKAAEAIMREAGVDIVKVGGKLISGKTIIRGEAINVYKNV